MTATTIVVDTAESDRESAIVDVVAMPRRRPRRRPRRPRVKSVAIVEDGATERNARTRARTRARTPTTVERMEKNRCIDLSDFSGTDRSV